MKAVPEEPVRSRGFVVSSYLCGRWLYRTPNTDGQLYSRLESFPRAAFRCAPGGSSTHAATVWSRARPGAGGGRLREHSDVSPRSLVVCRGGCVERAGGRVAASAFACRRPVDCVACVPCVGGGRGSSHWPRCGGESSDGGCGDWVCRGHGEADRAVLVAAGAHGGVCAWP